MNEINYPEIDVDRLMTRIREAAARRGTDFTVPEPAAPKFEPAHLNLSPAFQLRSDHCYQVEDFLKYHDRDFVWNAYRAILKREPDQKGFLNHIEVLRDGSLNKIDVLGSLRYSDEGKEAKVRVDGLRLPYRIRQLGRLPFIGYFLQLAVALGRLPATIRNQRKFEAYVLSQQSLIVDHFQKQSIELSRRVGQQSEKTKSVYAEVVEHDERLKAIQTEVKSHGLLLQVPETPEELEQSQALYAAFEEEFRGDSDEIRKRLQPYLATIREAVPGAKVLDLGSGYGDWLELMKAEGFEAYGVETNPFMVERIRKQGLEIVEEDVMAHLGKLSNNSVGVVTAFHLIEHLPFQSMIRLLDEVKRILMPGGLLILETPNPENLVVAACNFYSDPTHQRPIYPHTLTFILHQMGFSNLRLEYLHPVEESPFAADDPALQPLHTWFYGPRDFAVIARKN